MIHCNWCGEDVDAINMACPSCGQVGYLVGAGSISQAGPPSDPISAVEERLEMEADRELMRDEFHVR